MPHDMSLNMKYEKIHKNSIKTSPKKNIKKFWRPKTGGLNPHVKIGDSYEKESLEEDSYSVNDDHTIVKENPSVEENIEMTLLLCQKEFFGNRSKQKMSKPSCISSGGDS